MLREAVTACRTAITLTPPDQVRHDRYHRELRQLLLRLFTTTTDLDSRKLEEALRWSYPPTAGSPENGVPVACLAQLASALQLEYQHTDELPTLRDAVKTARRVVERTQPDDPDLVTYRSDLASLLWVLSGRDGDLGTLDEALRIMRETLSDLSPADERRGSRLNLLAHALKRRYELTGDVGALREAADVGREAVAAASRTRQDLPVSKGNLADVSRMLAERTSDLAMAREAVLLAQEAVGGLRADDAQWAGIQAVLGSAMTHLAVRTDDGQAITHAVRDIRKAVAATPVNHPDYLSRLDALHRALMFQYGKSKEPAVLEQAVKTARDLAGTAPADHPARSRYLSHLSRALREVFLAGNRNSVRDLKDSTEYARQAVAGTPPDHPDRAAALANLSDLLGLLFERTHDPVSLREFVTTNAAIARMGAATASQRIAAAQRAAHADLQLARGRHAITMIRLAVELLPQLGLRDVDRADREHRVSAAHRLPATAAAVAIAVGRPGHAVELLEQTRGVVFAGTLDTREDVAELRRAAPDLLPRFQQIRDDINAADHETTLPSFSEHRDATGRHPRELAARRATLSRQWDELVEEIRRRPGLAGFQKPTPITDLCRHAAQGPVVSVVADESRAHALIVRDDPRDPVIVVDLPGVTRATVVRQAEAFRTALGVALDREQPARARRHAQPRMLEVLAWTWDHITEPVLSRLGRTGPPPEGGPWPRVWWCPVGVVTMLPLHAAGHHDAPPYADTVMGRVISSYTPTIRALAHARRDSPGTPSTLVVAVPDAPGSPPLDGAREEADLVREFVPEAVVLPAAGATARRAAVIEVLRRHGIVHLACHGYANLHDPSASRLLLHDHATDPLTLHTITRLNLQHARLAYLSACSTTDTSQEQADEATHLTAAFQLAGYRSVIGTLWPINDRTALSVARDFYTELTAHRTTPPEPGRAAQALHRAVCELRDTAPALPSRWAAYIHSGA
ncbi:CHAT domain-containing protein [Streptomyces sp. ECR2.10]|uniref:CHAT domain-containing protein n=1 Tax=Streptomyces sp. ECR2.10 TaxID=3461012 RepID=UPI004040FD90